jgi:serpin B
MRGIGCLVLVLVLAAGSLAGPSAAQEVAAGSNAFGIELYRAVRSKPGNLFLSPYSVSVALTMAREGARGDTGRQMDAVLHRPEGAAHGHAALALALRPKLVRDGHGDRAEMVPSHELHVANALWGQKGLAFKKPFLDVLRNLYGAPFREIDFGRSEEARKIINEWVAENTKDRIRDIVPEGLPTSDTLLALANAIHFKASWIQPFQEESTNDVPFLLASERTVQCRLMTRADSFPYATVEGARLVELPYRGHETSMVVVLPTEGRTLGAVEESLTAEGLSKWLSALRPTRLVLGLPKFSFTSTYDLEETLRTMGMKDAFDGGKADFSGMTRAEKLFIGPVLHKAFIAVDEAGTEAAAATVVMMMRGAAPEMPKIQFIANRPFLFLIRHRATGAILFVGRVADPTKT